MVYIFNIVYVDWKNGKYIVNTIFLLQYLCVVTMLLNCLQMFNVKYEITNVNNTDCIKEKTQ